MKILRKKRTLLLLIAVIIVALTAFAACQPQGSDNKSVQPEPPVAEPQPQPQPQPEEQIPEDLKGYTEYTIKEQLGEKSNGGKDRIRKINIEGSEKENTVIIDLNGNDAYTANMTVRGMIMDSKKIFEPLSKREDVSGVSVSEYLDVADIGGGTVEEWVFTLTLDKIGLDKVAGGDYLLNDLTKMAKEYKIHPNFMRSAE